jgi:hypothetical protein
MQALAEPGTVCLSGSAHEYAQRVLPVTFEDLGPQSVKNMDAPIRAYLARPPGQLHSRAIPPVHRREVYLVRRLFRIIFKAMTEVVEPEGLAYWDMPALASIADAPGVDYRRLAERLAIDLKRAS